VDDTTSMILWYFSGFGPDWRFERFEPSTSPCFCRCWALNRVLSNDRVPRGQIDVGYRSIVSL